MKRIGVLTSGGDAPGMNAAIRAVVRTGMSLGMSVVGFKRGYNGILMRSEDHFDDDEELTARSVSGKIQHGGTFLMTARCQEFLDPAWQEKAIENMRSLGIEGLCASAATVPSRVQLTCAAADSPPSACPEPLTTT